MLSKKLLSIIGGIIVPLALVLTLVFAAGDKVSLTSSLFAANEVKTITFDGVNNSSHSGSTNITTANFSGGYIYCKTANNQTNQSEGFLGAFKTDTTMCFYEDAACTTEYTFEDLEKIILVYENNAGLRNMQFTLNALYVDGSTFTNDYVGKSSTGTERTLSFANLSNVSHLSLTCNSSTVYRLTGVRIEYNCNPKYLTGVEITNNPAKTSYLAGETFNSTGMLVKAVYSNGTKVATNSYTYSPKTALTTDVENIVVSFGGLSTNVPITVSEISLSGKVYTASSNRTISFTNDSDGTYTYVDGSSVTHTLYFSYAVSQYTLTFTYVSGDNDSFGLYRLFDLNLNPNVSGRIKSSTEFSVRIYRTGDTTLEATFKTS